MQRRHLLVALLMLTATLTLAGCGFQLRGSFNLPPNLKAVTIDGKEPYSALLVQTRELLKSAGVDTPDDGAPYTLYVTDEELGKTRFTQNQNVLYDEFMLTHEAKFELRREDGSLILKPQEVGEMTLFQDDKSTAGTKLNEENILRAELAQKLAVKILRRIQAVKPAQWEAQSSDTKGVATDTLDAAPDKDKASEGDNKPSSTSTTPPDAKKTDAPAP